MSLSIIGTGSALPAQILKNNDLTAFLDTSDEWIRTRTGIEERHILGENEGVTDLAEKAALAALSSAGLHAKDIDYILCATLAGDYITPGLGCVVQERIGATCPALDVNGACSGFLYALDVADCMLSRGKVKRILLIAAEGLSRISDWTDRATCVLFGDGAGAVVLESGDDLLYMNVTVQGDAKPLHALFPSGNFPGKERTPDSYIRMEGSEVFKFAVRTICSEIETALEQTQIRPEQIKHVLLHQANLRIIDSARKKIGIPPENYRVNISRVGNLSAASIPVLLDECNKSGQMSSGDLFILAGFGAGFTSGTAILRWK